MEQKPKTPEEREEIAKKEAADTIKEAEMLKGGGKYVVDEDGKVSAFELPFKKYEDKEGRMITSKEEEEFANSPENMEEILQIFQDVLSDKDIKYDKASQIITVTNFPRVFSGAPETYKRVQTFYQKGKMLYFRYKEERFNFGPEFRTGMIISSKSQLRKILEKMRDGGSTPHHLTKFDQRFRDRGWE